jgi:hypothetical protein
MSYFACQVGQLYPVGFSDDGLHIPTGLFAMPSRYPLAKAWRQGPLVSEAVGVHLRRPLQDCKAHKGKEGDLRIQDVARQALEYC